MRRFSEFLFSFFFRLKEHSITDWQKIEIFLTDGSKNGFVIGSDLLDVLKTDLKEKFKFTKLNEKIMTTLWGFRFENNHFMFKAYNRKIVQLVESGIADLIVKNHAPKRYEEPFSEPKKLTLEHLDFWFIILTVFCGFALLCFLGEVLIAKVQRAMKGTQVFKF